MGHDLGPRPGTPDVQLLDRRGTERVCCREDDTAAARTLDGGELTDRRGLAGPVHADDEDDGGLARSRGPWLPGVVSRGEEAGELGPDRRFRSARVAPAAGPLDDVDREHGADVPGNERFLDVIPRWTLGATAEKAAQSGHEPAPRLREARREVDGFGPLRRLIEVWLDRGLQVGRSGTERGRRIRDRWSLSRVRCFGLDRRLEIGVDLVDRGRFVFVASPEQRGDSSSGGLAAGQSCHLAAPFVGDRLGLVEPEADDPAHRIVAGRDAV
jgi:hypothetical protein